MRQHCSAPPLSQVTTAHAAYARAKLAKGKPSITYLNPPTQSPAGAHFSQVKLAKEEATITSLNPTQSTLLQVSISPMSSSQRERLP